MTLKMIIKTVFMVELIQGLTLTLKTMFTKPVTRQYPEEPRDSAPGFRGMHALVRESSTGREKCIACGLCGAICPAKCIHIHSAEGPDNRKVAERYEIDLLRCVFCALCVEACPVGAIVLTEHYAYSDYSRDAFYMDKKRLLENWDLHMAGEKGKRYLRDFWHPTSADYEEHPGQAVFKGPAQLEDKDAS